MTSTTGGVAIAATQTVATPDMQYGLLSPMLVVFGVAVLGVLVEAFAPRGARYPIQIVLGVVATLGAVVAVVLVGRGEPGLAAGGAVAVSGTTLFLQGALAVLGALSLGLVAQRRGEVTRALSRVGADSRVGVGPDVDTDVDTDAGEPGHGLASFTAMASCVPDSPAERAADRVGFAQTEVFPLVLLALGGMMLLPAANDLVTLFVALEVLSLPLYILCGLARHRRLLSQEAALKYFLLGAYSSAFLLFGIAMLYGYAGTLRIDGIGAAVATREAGSSTMLVLLGAALVAVGLLFKVGAVPFQAWVPDVYQGAPTPITAFMAAATKVAGFGALLRIAYVALPDLQDQWRPTVWVVAIATMVVGSVTAVTQTDVKRMLAYSSIAHAGFVLTAFVATGPDAVAAVLFYLVVYGLGTIAAFALVGAVRDRDGAEVTSLAAWAGLGRRSPVLAGTFAVLLLAFAGIPLTAGFIAKFTVFEAAASAGGAVLVWVGVVCSAIAAYFYLRVIVVMYFDAGTTADDGFVPASGGPEPSTDDARVAVTTTGPAAAVVIAVGVVTVVVLGIAPQPLLDLADRAAALFW